MKMRWKTLAPLLAGMLAGPCTSSAQSQAPAPCEGPEAAQFDFWIGDWDVFQPDGKPAGTNRIERLYGCVLHESWRGGNGRVLGQSFNRWDRDRGVWHQTWVDNQGGLLLLEGRFAGGAMTLDDAAVPGKKDPAAINRIRWSVNPDGSVRQLWSTSPDGGKTWTVAFDGKYVRSDRPQPK